MTLNIRDNLHPDLSIVKTLAELELFDLEVYEFSMNNPVFFFRLINLDQNKVFCLFYTNKMKIRLPDDYYTPGVVFLPNDFGDTVTKPIEDGELTTFSWECIAIPENDFETDKDFEFYNNGYYPFAATNFFYDSNINLE